MIDLTAVRKRLAAGLHRAQDENLPLVSAMFSPTELTGILFALEAIEQVKAAERERCAILVESTYSNWTTEQVLTDLAKEIRELK